jgi:hypothetical protein
LSNLKKLDSEQSHFTMTKHLFMFDLELNIKIFANKKGEILATFDGF